MLDAKGVLCSHADLTRIWRGSYRACCTRMLTHCARLASSTRARTIMALLSLNGSFILAAAVAYLRGIERRIEAGLPPRVCSVASLFISRWDGATAKTLPPELVNLLGIAVGEHSYQAYRDLLASDRFERLCNSGAVPQRLLFASTGTKDPKLSESLYIEALAAPNTINTMPEKTLHAFAERGRVTATLSAGGGLADSTIFAI